MNKISEAYDFARKKLKDAEFTSSIDTEDEKLPQKRKNAGMNPFYSTESEEESSEENKPKKLKKSGAIPRPPTVECCEELTINNESQPRIVGFDEDAEARPSSSGISSRKDCDPVSRPPVVPIQVERNSPTPDSTLKRIFFKLEKIDVGMISIKASLKEVINYVRLQQLPAEAPTNMPKIPLSNDKDSENLEIFLQDTDNYGYMASTILISFCKYILLAAPLFKAIVNYTHFLYGKWAIVFITVTLFKFAKTLVLLSFVINFKNNI